MLRYVRTFLPWIAFAVLSTNGEARWGALVGFVVACGLVVLDRRAGRPWDALVLEISSAAFFGALAAVALTVTPAPFGDFGPAVAVGWLALTAWGTLAIRRPFTLAIARTMVPAEVQGSPVFYRVNAVITTVWAVAFTLNSGLLGLLLAVAPHATVAIVAVKVCGFAIPAVFTVAYSKAVAARRGPAGVTDTTRPDLVP
ncbi:MAG: hypothetical protein HOY78_36530 [Saccharothrix sp.]|nr:hypothetical protein [Saccharothrix sp.]